MRTQPCRQRIREVEGERFRWQYWFWMDRLADKEEEEEEEVEEDVYTTELNVRLSRTRFPRTIRYRRKKRVTARCQRSHALFPRQTTLRIVKHARITWFHSVRYGAHTLDPFPNLSLLLLFTSAILRLQRDTTRAYSVFRDPYLMPNPRAQTRLPNNRKLSDSWRVGRYYFYDKYLTIFVE